MRDERPTLIERQSIEENRQTPAHRIVVVDGGRFRGDFLERLVLATAFDPTEHLTRDDAIHPALERSFAAKSRQTAEDGHERFLRQVVDVAIAAREIAHEIAHAREQLYREGFERLAISTDPAIEESLRAFLLGVRVQGHLHRMIETGGVKKRSTAVLFSFAVLCDPGNAALKERIDGQLRDLGLSVEWSVEPPAGEGPTQLRSADRMAADHEAKAVVWFRIEGGAIEIFVSSSQRLFARSVGDAAATSASSATLETIALVLRGALKALASGATIGIERPIEAPAPKPQVFAPPAPPPSDPVRFATLFGWRVGVDGAPIHQGPSARIGIGWRRLEIALSSAISLPTTTSDAAAAFTLTRYSASAFAGMHVLDAPVWSFVGGIEAGVVGVHRTTLPLVVALAPSSPATTISPVLAGLVEARARLSRGLRFVIIAGAEIVPLAPDVGYGSADGFHSVVRSWTVQPRVELGLLVGTN